MDTRTIATYLQRNNWTYWEVDRHTLLTGFRCAIPFYDFGVPIEIRITPYWVNLIAFLQRGVTGNSRAQVMSFLSSLNASCRGVRFFLVEDCAVLKAEVAVARCRFEAFNEALRNICRYATLSGLEVAVLATNASVARLYEQVDNALLARLGVGHGREIDAMADFELTFNQLFE